MLRTWGGSEFRPTMDIDMLGMTSNKHENIVDQIRKIMMLYVSDDGLQFQEDSIKTEVITEDADYRGVRVLMICHLGSARVNIQVDIGFGDVVYPQPSLALFPTLLDFPAPKLLCYSRESAIAEKFDVMITLGVLNSRMKDFYDIWLLSRQFDFNGLILFEAVKRTLENRSRTIDGEIVAFTNGFALEKQIQWNAFRNRMKRVLMPEHFTEVVAHVERFMAPIVEALQSGTFVPKVWKAPGPWIDFRS